MLGSLGRFCHERRWIIVAIWLAVLVALGAASSAIGPSFGAGFEVPDGEAADGFDLLEEHFGGQGAGMVGQIVFRADDVTDPAVAEPMSDFFAAVAAQPDITLVDPYGEMSLGQINPQMTHAFATLEAPIGLSQTEIFETADRVKEEAPNLEGVSIEYGGDLFIEFEPPEAEALGLAFAIFILIAAFGSVLAMGVPVGTALAGIGVGSIITALATRVIDMPEFTPVLGLMIGLGVGIDYALFIVTRYREELHKGASPVDATAIAIDTAGRAVLFAGVTVVISLLGMVIIGLSFVTGLAVGASLIVFVTMIASITLLPALLGFVGNRIDITRRSGLIAAAMVALALVGVGLGRTEITQLALPIAGLVILAGLFVPFFKTQLPPRKTKPVEQTLPYRWSRLIQKHPWPFAIIGTGLLIVLTLPVLGLRLGFSDTGNLPEEQTARRAYDMLAEGFGPGFNGPILLVAEAEEADIPQLLAVTEQLNNVEGVAFASPPIPNNIADPFASEAVLWRVIPETAPQDEATADLLTRLRDGSIEQTAGVDIAVTGTVAVGADFSSYLSRRIPLFFGAVLTLSFLLLMAVFRSVLVPFKAVIMNLLSIGAAYGIIVAVFQWGWFIDLVGVGKGGPIEPFLPMMMFAIVFGLSMDYEVFLLSRVKEEYDRTGDNASAVADGLASTARVISAAAAIMVFVFGSFLLEDDRIIKMFGSGLALAVLLDATLVRLLLVPATMELLGDRNWWLPRWLDKILPNLDVEGGHHDEGSTIGEPPHDPDRELAGAA